MICDDPELLKQLENRYVDTEYDKWLEEFDKEQEQIQAQQEKEKTYTPDLPDSETISWRNTPKPQKQIPPMLAVEHYNTPVDTGDIDDWEKEE